MKMTMTTAVMIYVLIINGGSLQYIVFKWVLPSTDT